MRPAAGRADVLRLLVALGEAQASRAAQLLGYEAEEPAEEPARESPAKTDPTTVERPRVERAPPGTVPFWRASAMELHTPPAGEPEIRPGLTAADLTTPHASLFRTPPPIPLAAWPRLWPRLRALLPSSAPGREPDLPSLVRALASGLPLGRIARRRRRAWASGASVWIDLSARLVPFESDQYDVLARLRRALGRSALEVRSLVTRAQEASIAARGDLLAGVRIDATVPVIVLGDLGAYAGSPALHDAWRRTARRLSWHGVRVAALVPAPPARWHRPTARAWRALAWERAGGPPSREPDDPWRIRAERLLRLASPAAYVQPGLLRALRRLLPADRVDAAAEADVWRHADVRAADAGGLVLRAAAASRWREDFATSIEISDDLRRRVSDVIRRWHEGLPAELLCAETLAWHAILPAGVAPPGNLDDALAFGRRVAESAGGGGAAEHVARRYGQIVTPALPGRAFTGGEVGRLLVRMFAASFQGLDDVAVPDGVDPQTLLDEIRRLQTIDEPGPPQRWAVRQVGATLRFEALPASGAWASGDPRPGSPVGWLHAASLDVVVSRRSAGAAYGHRTKPVLHAGLAIDLHAGEDVRLDADLSTLELQASPASEGWATAMGRDHHGLWADAEIMGVVQRFRYVPPGTVRVGSPPGEAGRLDNEGPMHQVTWTRGYWLADTPVTQALWQVMMGDNPSAFKSATRPVENVSHQDCERFLRALEQRAAGLAPRLPTEAEWEYACRGGTETATWLGDLAIEGENNAPLLDDIAWYGGNCGHGYDLADGVDISSWPERQYPDEKGGTRAVATRRASPFGLFDMLGNVWEWCADSSSPYESRDLINPAPRNVTGSDRVLRGGSWVSFARLVRAAQRYASAPGSRDSSIGFRLARGQVPAGGTESPPRSGSGPGAAGRGPSSTATRDAATPGRRKGKGQR